MPRFAAIDVGSNASRLRIVAVKEIGASSGSVDPEHPTPGWKTLVSERVPARLGHSVFQTGRLAPEMVDLEVETMRRFADLMEDHEVDSYRAVVTASARDAENGHELIERVRREAGIRLEAIDGLEEARLVRLAVGMKLDLGGHVLLMDLGGGSLELSELEENSPRFTTSLPVGTVRFLEAYMNSGGAVSPREDALVREALERTLSPLSESFSGARFDRLVGTGGNLEAIAKLCGEQKGTNAVFTTKAAELALEKLKKLSPKERTKKFDLKPDRADVIVPALYVVTALARLVAAEVVDVPRVGLREGLLREQVERHFRVWDAGREHANVIASARAFGRRFHFDERHGAKVAALSRRLFSALSALHDLGDDDARVLEVAAWLHDVGEFVSPTGHDRHSQYLIEHGEIVGLSPAERREIALLARYHRRTPLDPKGPDLKGMGAQALARFSWLTGMLRVADALDREHRSKVGDLRVKLEDGVIALELVAEDDVALETWSVGRKAELLESMAGRKIEVRVA